MSIQDFEVISGDAPAAIEPKREPVAVTMVTMQDEDQAGLHAQLERLRQEHRDLDAAIEALANVPGRDLLQLQRLKKRKLILRDRIIQIEDELTPDIIA